MNIKKFLCSFLVALSLCALCACGKKDETDYVTIGYEKLEEPDYASAEQNFNEAVEQGRDLTLAYRGLGICYMNKGEYDKAIEQFKKALSEDGATPDDIDFDINYYIGVCYHKLGKYEDAKERYDAIIALRPREVDAYMQRAAEYLYLQDVDSACTDFEKALSLKK